METLSLTDVFCKVRDFHSFCEENSINFREVAENILNDFDDFCVDDYLFINKNSIDDIQISELESDAYMLGCFNAWFIADNTNLSLDIVEALQASEKYEAIGQYIIDNNLVKDIQQAYASADGYGHHFNPYDGSEEEISDYYIFRTN